MSLPPGRPNEGALPGGTAHNARDAPRTVPSRAALWATLVDRGLAAGELPARSEQRSPWYVRVMLGIAGWIGAVFLFAFVGTLFVFALQSAFASIAIGALTCAGAALIFRSSPKGDFAAQFGLAVSLAGQALIVYGLAKWFDQKLWPIALVMTAVQAALFALVPNFIHRVWVAWTGLFAAALALGDLRLHYLMPALVTAAFAWVWIREFDFGTKGATMRAGGYGLALASMQLVVMHGGSLSRWFFEPGGPPLGGQIAIWLGDALSAAVLLFAVVLLLRRERVALASPPGRAALIGAALLGIASFKAPGIGPAATILVVGFANGNRVLAGLGVLALLGYLSHYYYSLEATLLEKSIILACTGLALLVARLALNRWWPLQAKEVSHA
jgi:hypothetical protein